jgi:hypothetical protein
MNTTTVLTDVQPLELNTDLAQSTTDLDKPLAGTEAVEAMTPTVLPPDARQAIFNEGAIGPIEHIQVSTERIVRLNGILFDIDPTNLSESPLLPGLSLDCKEFYDQCLRRWLSNHPVLEHLEVRASGTGLHAILWLDPPVDFGDEAERTRWCSIVKVVQAVLPTDPMAPGITATTRVLGSVNTKNGQEVRRLKEGHSVSTADVIALQQEMCAAPFKTLFQILTGSDRISPCSFCGKESLVALNHVGKCYGCGKVTFERLCQELFQAAKTKEG